MTVYTWQKVLARRTADERERRHEASRDDRKWVPNGYCGADIHYIGLLGEFAFHNNFDSTEPDLSFIPAGDAGADLLYAGHRVDVKVSTYTGRNQYLRVPVDRMHEQTIYVAALYDPDADDVNLLRWEWGWQLVRENNVQRFGEHQTDNYVKLVTACRRLTTLALLQQTEEPCPIATW